MNWYRFRTVKSKLHHRHRATSNVPKAAKRAELLRRTSQIEPEFEAERRRRAGSVSTPTEDAVAVERT
eukprot:7093066-Prymnesium_polylepis.1